MNALNFNFKKASGFSLIELMVVIAIVALLASVAVPSYKQYINRSKVAEINGLVANAQEGWGTGYSSGNFPASGNAAGNYIASITYSSSTTGAIVIVLDSPSNIDASLDGLTMTWNATVATTPDNTITWACVISTSSSATTAATFLQNGCA